MTRILLSLALALAAPVAYPQEYPEREIRSICNFAPGSGADIIVRYYSDQLSKLAGKPVIVENKLGARHRAAHLQAAAVRPAARLRPGDHDQLAQLRHRRGCRQAFAFHLGAH